MSTPGAGQAAAPLGDAFHNGKLDAPPSPCVSLRVPLARPLAPPPRLQEPSPSLPSAFVDICRFRFSSLSTGRGTAGNKSFCSYRLGLGVPGYTGFVPMEENIDIPTKSGCAKRAPLARGDAAHGDGGTIMRPQSSFRHDFSLTPSEFAQGTAPNPLWDLKGKRPVGDPPFIRRPVDDIDRHFMGKSTFSDSYDQGLEVAQQDYPSNVTHTGQLRPPGANFQPLATTAGEVANPFYQTEYMQKSEEGNLLMATKKVLPPGPAPRERANRQISGVALKNPQLSTTYRKSFGVFGVDPL